ncbi:MAG: VWA domain-containing protein [Planctomycetota bacterium]
MEFLAPSFLWLLLATPLVFAPKGARRHLGHSGMRWAMCSLLILALARPAKVDAEDKEHWILLVDQSASLSAEGLAQGEALAQQLQENLPAHTILQRIDFGSASSSPLGDALRTAAERIPWGEAGCVILASDGAATVTDWSATNTLSMRGIPIHVLQLATDAVDPRIVGLYATQALRVGHPATVKLQLEGQASDVRVSLQAVGSEDALVTSEAFVLDGPQEISLSFEPAAAGFLAVEAKLEVKEGVNTHVDNDVWSRSFAVQDPTPVLFLGDRIAGGGEALAEVLGPGFELQEQVDLAQAMPAHYPLVVLDDRPASKVPDAFQQRLQDAVTEQGTGLLMSGGSGSFGPGGWADTPVADLLPVDFVQKEEKRDPSTTLVVIIDTSGSMGGNRVQLAKEVARLAIQRLLPHDKAGIVEFYGAKHWAAPIQPASNIIELERALNRMSAGGGTVILPAIEEAFYALQNIQTRYKHVLVLTDGGVETGDFESLLRNMTDEGITTSTVLIGSQAHSEFLVNMSNWGKGRFYNVPNRFNLPEVILKQPASAKLPAYRPGGHRVEGRGSAAWWADTDPRDIPELDGYVETRARVGAEVLLETAEGHHPVFASWRFGLGRVSALTTEPVGPGTRNWQDWDGLGPFLAQLYRRTADDFRDPFHYTLERRGPEVILTARRRSAAEVQPMAQTLESESPRSFAFQELAPGWFEARLLVDPSTTLQVEASNDLTPGRITRLISDARADHLPERQVAADAFLPMLTLAAQTGGAMLGPDSTDLAVSAGQSQTLRTYAPWLLAFAILLFLADILFRRRVSFDGGAA